MEVTLKIDMEIEQKLTEKEIEEDRAYQEAICGGFTEPEEVPEPDGKDYENMEIAKRGDAFYNLP